jgi:PAS domain S-box-containing protein
VSPRLVRARRIVSILILAVLVVSIGFWLDFSRFPALPDRPLRIGFESNPPMQIRTAAGEYTGLAVDAVKEAARRAGLELQWVETSLGPDEALARGVVDLWPAMTDLPERRHRVHISRAWLLSNFFLLTRSSARLPQSSFAGSIGTLRLPVYGFLIAREFPQSRIARYLDGRDLMRDLCVGKLGAVFLGGRSAGTALREKPAECKDEIRVVNLPGATGQIGVASTFAAGKAAEELRQEIGGMFRDGSLANIITRYSYYLDDPWSTYELMQAAERSKWMSWGLAALAAALSVTLWQALSLRRARKAAEAANAATRQALARHQLIARVTNDALFEYDFRTGAAVWNEAAPALFGYEPARAPQMGWWNERIHPDDRRRIVDGVRAAMLHCAPTWSDEYRFRRADGSYATVVDRVHFTYEGEKPSTLVRAVMDVSARRRLEEELRSAQKMEAVGRLAGGVAHDFNNLLTIVLGYGSLLEDSFRSGRPAAEHVPVIMTAASQAARLTQQLLAFSRRQVLRPEVLNLNTVILEMEKVLRGVLREDIELDLSLAADLASIRADRAQIEQVVMNLCLNAREAMQPGGKLTIETCNALVQKEEPGGPRPGVYSVLSVADTGCGMDPETRAHIFEPFFTTKDLGKGTGLGLSTCHGIVKQSGGEIVARSEPGRGSTFVVYLPRWIEVESVPAGQTGSSLSGQASRARRP